MSSIYFIDGAVTKNGKKDCISASAFLCINTNKEPYIEDCANSLEFASTSQRGELNALKMALYDMLIYRKEHTLIYTDSSFTFDCFNKDWLNRWKFNGWIKKDGTRVKNKDILESLQSVKMQINEQDLQPAVLFVKSHTFSIGKVTSTKYIEGDPTLNVLFKACLEKIKNTDLTKYIENRTLQDFYSEQFNGHNIPSADLFQIICAGNMAVDMYVKYILEKEKQKIGGIA